MQQNAHFLSWSRESRKPQAKFLLKPSAAQRKFICKHRHKSTQKRVFSQTPFSFFLQKEKGFGCPKEKTQRALWCTLLSPACEIRIVSAPSAAAADANHTELHSSQTAACCKSKFAATKAPSVNRIRFRTVGRSGSEAQRTVDPDFARREASSAPSVMR